MFDHEIGEKVTDTGINTLHTDTTTHESVLSFVLIQFVFALI